MHCHRDSEKQVELSGTPWLKGQKKMLGFAALTVNRLCTPHIGLLCDSHVPSGSTDRLGWPQSQTHSKSFRRFASPMANRLRGFAAAKTPTKTPATPLFGSNDVATYSFIWRGYHGAVYPRRSRCCR